MAEDSHRTSTHAISGTHAISCAKAHDHLNACTCHLGVLYPEPGTELTVAEATKRINDATQMQIDAAKRREELGVNDIAKQIIEPKPNLEATLAPFREETINHPRHYGGDTTYEAIKVIEAWGLDFSLGNAVIGPRATQK